MTTEKRLKNREKSFKNLCTIFWTCGIIFEGQKRPAKLNIKCFREARVISVGVYSASLFCCLKMNERKESL